MSGYPSSVTEICRLVGLPIFLSQLSAPAFFQPTVSLAAAHVDGQAWSSRGYAVQLTSESRFPPGPPKLISHGRPIPERLQAGRINWSRGRFSATLSCNSLIAVTERTSSLTVRPQAGLSLFVLRFGLTRLPERAPEELCADHSRCSGMGSAFEC